MTEQECLAKMVAPAGNRPSKPYLGGVIQIHVARACDKACYSCTQGSQLSGKPRFISLENFEACCKSLVGYWGIVGMFGGNPATHPLFDDLCSIMEKHILAEQRGLWCNNPLTVEKARRMNRCFNPRYSNLNVHLDRRAYAMFKDGWPQSMPCGLDRDSRHSPPFVAMKDVVTKECPDCERGEIRGTEENGWRDEQCGTCDASGNVPDESAIYELISNCDINQKWSAMCGEFRGEPRAWFCEIAGAQSILHQDEPDYPDTGLPLWCDPNLSTPGEEKGGGILVPWWVLKMPAFVNQVRHHCFSCGIPLRGHGCDAQSADGIEQVSETHKNVFKPKVAGRTVELVTDRLRLGQPLGSVVRYLQNAGK